MKKVELISMVKFVLADHEARNDNDAFEFSNLVLIYANFLNTPLNISMFVPAIEVNCKWEVLEKPKEENYIFGVGDKPRKMIVDPQYDKDCEQYQNALDNVLFEGFTYVKGELWIGFNMIYQGFKFKDKIVQDLIKYKPTLTKQGQKLSGL